MTGQPAAEKLKKELEEEERNGSRAEASMIFYGNTDFSVGKVKDSSGV